MSQLQFEYSIEKDVENFLRATESKNNTNYTDLAQQYVRKHSESFNPESVKGFLLSYQKENGLEPKEMKNEMSEQWGEIEDEYVSRTGIIFGISYPVEKVVAYLTTESRCTYNIENRYFFVSMQYPDHSNHICMHELFHFYTWKRFRERLIEVEGFKRKGQYNDIKESLTELLNIEYSDLLGDISDKGYPQHQELRGVVREVWKETGSIEKVINVLIGKLNTVT